MTIATALESWGEVLWHWLLWMNLWTALLFLAALVLDRLLRPRVAAAWRILLYAPLAVRLLIPLGWAAPVALLALPTVVERNEAMSASAQESSPPSESSEATVDDSAAAVRTSERTWWSNFSLVLPIHAAGVAGFFLLWWRDHRRLHRMVRESTPLPEELGAPVQVHPSAGPLLAGVFRPRIVVPRHLVSPPSPSLTAVLRHERAHLARHDQWLAAVVHAIVVVCWPIVPLWLAAARVRSLMEQAADELALRGVSKAHRIAYADALIDVAEQLRNDRRRLAMGASLGFGHGLRSRVRALADTRRWPVLAQAAVVAPLAALLIGCAGGRTMADDNPGRTINGSRVQLVVLNAIPPSLAGAVSGMRQEQLTPEHTPPRPEGPIARPTISDKEVSDLLNAAGKDGVAARAAILLRDGGMGSVRVTHPGHDSAVTDGHTFSVRLGEVNDERSVLSLDYREMTGGQSLRWANTGPISIPAGRTAYVIAHGEKGVPLHVVLITPQPARLALENSFNPMDATQYPVIDCRVWLHRLPERVTFETLVPDAPLGENTGSLITAPPSAAGNRLRFEPPAGNRPGPIPWAHTLRGSMNDYLRLLSTVAHAELVCAPAVMVRPGEAARIQAERTDKAGQSLGDHAFEIVADEDGGEVRLTVRFSTRRPDGEEVTLSTLEGWSLGPGEAVSWIQPPATPDDDQWYIVTVAPRVISSQAEYPFQTFEAPPNP